MPSILQRKCVTRGSFLFLILVFSFSMAKLSFAAVSPEYATCAHTGDPDCRVENGEYVWTDLGEECVEGSSPFLSSDPNIAGQPKCLTQIQIEEIIKEEKPLVSVTLIIFKIFIGLLVLKYVWGLYKRKHKN